MLKANLRPSERIQAVTRIDNALILSSPRGTLRILPIREDILRISYLEEGELSDQLLPYFLARGSFKDWTYREDSAEIWLDTGRLQVRIDRETAGLSYLDNRGVLLKEKQGNSRSLAPFDAYRLVVDEHTQIKKVETPDGTKLMVKDPQRVFDKRLYHTRLSLCFDAQEALYGLGQQEEGSLNLRGTTQYLNQANMKIAVPLLVSSKGYGLLLATGSPAIFSDTAYGSYLYCEAEPQMDYFFIAGKQPADVIKGYRFLTGKAPMLPRWSMGYLQSQERYETQADMLQVAREYHELGIGVDAFILDWNYWLDGHWGQKSFDPARFPDPAKLCEQLHQQGLHMLISIWPNMDETTENHQAFLQQQLLLPANTIYNALSAEGRALFWQQAKQGIFDHGVDGWWCDSSEPFTPEWSQMNKPEPHTMYQEFCEMAAQYLPNEETNAYAFYHAMGMYEGQREATAEKRVINLTRSGYTGQQRYGVVLWSGDISATWDTLRRQIAAGLNLCASGIPYWTLDAGAFFVKRGVQWFWDGDYDRGWDDPDYRELAVRWFQYAAFLPIYRGHGTDILRHWDQLKQRDERLYTALLQSNRLRYRLLPYLYALMSEVWFDDATMMRPLGFDFAEDMQALDVADQYMLGRLMVCPITESGAEARSVYLPAGTDWYDLYTHAHYQGGQTVQAAAPIERIPVFVQAGTILPMLNEDTQRTQQAFDLSPQLYIFDGPEATLHYYEDAGDGYGYESGEYARTHLRWDGKALVVGNTEGSYLGRDPRDFETVLVKGERHDP